MSKFKHTPGPWHYVDYSPQFNGYFPVYDIRDDNGGCVAEVVHTESDARLITFSPDMLDYLIIEARELWTQQRLDDIGADELRLAPPIALVESATGLPIEEVLK